MVKRQENGEKKGKIHIIDANVMLDCLFYLQLPEYGQGCQNLCQILGAQQPLHQ